MKRAFIFCGIRLHFQTGFNVPIAIGFGIVAGREKVDNAKRFSSALFIRLDAPRDAAHNTQSVLPRAALLLSFMFTPFILFLGLSIATAVIAHWSDNLGKKLGKKRVSLFGLRPRTTATILTVASSWGIMLFTLAALLITVAPLRRALFSYDRERAQASRDREQFERERKAAKLNLTNTQAERNRAQSDLETANSNLKKSRAAAQFAETEGNKRAEAAKKRAEAAETAADAAQKRVELAQTRFEVAQKRFEVAQKREAAARKGEAAAQGETRNAERETKIAEVETQKARQLRDEASADLKSSLSDLKSAESQLQTTQDNLKTTKISLDNAKSSAFEAQKAAFAAQKDLAQTKRQIAALESQKTELQNLAAATLSNDAPIKIRQTFAARVIAANQTPGAIAAQLRAMLKQGQQSFAETEENSPVFPPDAKIQLLPLPGQDSSGKPAIFEGERLLQSLARDIAASGQTTSIRLIAPRNYLANEKNIEAVFVAVPIAPAFAEGEILASTTIDGAQGDARIFRSLFDLVDIDGRREAEKRGVNPPQSPDEPNFYAAGTNVRLFAALRYIENSKARLRVNLVAAKDLSTVEPLQVFFQIEGVVEDASSNSNTPAPSL